MPNLALVGATGAVGTEVIKILEQRHFPVTSIRFFGSERSAGKYIPLWNRNAVKIELLHEGCFRGTDIAIFSAGSDVSKVWAPAAKANGCVAIDNSTAFRMNADVPLVIPEINAGDLEGHNGIIANPNCTTAITLVALWPLHKEFSVRRIIASSYQSVSGAGQRGIDELTEQVTFAPTAEPKFFPHRIAFNVFPQVDSFQLSGYTKEEEKMQNEGRKIMHHPIFRASVTCVRVPVFRAHSISVCAEFERPLTYHRALEVLSEAPGLEVVDGRIDGAYPTPLDASEKDLCFVGRVRRDKAFDNGLSFFVCGDQLRKGAALNAVQIAELLIKK